MCVCAAVCVCALAQSSKMRTSRLYTEAYHSNTTRYSTAGALSTRIAHLLYSDRNHGTVRNTRELVKVFAISRANWSRLKGIFIWVVSPFNFLEVLCYHIRAQGGCGLLALLTSERSKPVGVMRIEFTSRLGNVSQITTNEQALDQTGARVLAPARKRYQVYVRVRLYSRRYVGARVPCIGRILILQAKLASLILTP